MKLRGTRSPLKDTPLRLPGQSIHERLVDLAFGRLLPWLWVASTLFILAVLEWAATVGHWRRVPWLYTTGAVVSGALCTFQFWRSREPIRQLQLGRDGERHVGEYLERLREHGAHVFHDVPGEDFDLDHVLLCRRGIFVIETKTRSKPVGRDARVTFTADSVLVGGHPPERDPVRQVQACARRIEQLLKQSTGAVFSVHGVVLFPGWFVAPMTDEWKRTQPWVLAPKALPAFIDREPQRLDESEVRMAAFHLERYIRAEIERRARKA